MWLSTTGQLIMSWLCGASSAPKTVSSHVDNDKWLFYNLIPHKPWQNMKYICSGPRICHGILLSSPLLALLLKTITFTSFYDLFISSRLTPIKIIIWGDSHLNLFSMPHRERERETDNYKYLYIRVEQELWETIRITRRSTMSQWNVIEIIN